MPQPSLPFDALRARLAGVHAGFRVEAVDEIDSTNTELMRRARAGSDAPVLLVARRQTAGRGRIGRPWQSAQAGTAEAAPDASLTFSMGLPLAPRDWSGLSLAVGVAVADSLDPGGSARLALKWPNDLWVDDRKLGGILIETALSQAGPGPSGERYVVIGVGLNIGARDATGMSVPPACLREWQPQATPASALDALAAPLLQAVHVFAAQGFAAFAERFAARDALAGRDVQLSDGTAGLCQGVGWGGELLVHTAHGMKTISSSEVSVRPRRAAP